MPYLAGINIYPIKSLDGIAITQATILKSGALKHDREFAIFDQKGEFVNGKRHAQVHLLRSFFDITTRTVSFQVQDTEQTWAASCFNHFFKLAVNTRVPESEERKTIQVKEAIKILDKVKATVGEF